MEEQKTSEDARFECFRKIWNAIKRRKKFIRLIFIIIRIYNILFDRDLLSFDDDEE